MGQVVALRESAASDVARSLDDEALGDAPQEADESRLDAAVLHGPSLPS